MKWIFSLLIFSSLQTKARELIVISGEYKKSKNIIEKVLLKNIGIPKNFLTFEKGNSKCTKRNDAVIQFCFHGKDFKVIHEKKDVLEKTLKRVLALNEKSPLKEGLGINK